MDNATIRTCQAEILHHLMEELLPFWLTRCVDDRHGGFITHFDKDGHDTGEDEKSLIAQSRLTYSMSLAHRAGFGDGRCADLAAHGVEYLLDRMWDQEAGGFFWMTDRKSGLTIDKKILYGQSFAVYALSEYTLATGDPVGLEFAQKTFDLIRERCRDFEQGGYFEMFDRNWNLAGPGNAGGDRKTLDVHMHLMEAFTVLTEAGGAPEHKDALAESVDLLCRKMLHPQFGTGIPQFTPDWKVAPQIKLDVVWGWDRFGKSGAKENAQDNTSYGHNAELAWLMIQALEVLGASLDEFRPVLRKLLDHVADHGIDEQYGGVFVEGPHSGGCHDRQKEFWQQAETMIGLLDACLMFGPEKFWPAYKNVHRFVFDKVIHHEIGEWWPLLTRQGEPIWTHMGHSWKINYHTIRAMILCMKRLDRMLHQPGYSTKIK